MKADTRFVIFGGLRKVTFDEVLMTTVNSQIIPNGSQKIFPRFFTSESWNYDSDR